MVDHAEDGRQRDTLGAIKTGARIDFDFQHDKAGRTSCFPRVDGRGGIGIPASANNLHGRACSRAE